MTSRPKIPASIRQQVSLFNPQTQIWNQHFAWSQDGLYAEGQTASGRATIDALRLNSERLVRARKIWMLVGLHPSLD
ncbi:MAG: hypothetical protein AAF614_39530 [Chloroflexota bacterium]